MAGTKHKTPLLDDLKEGKWPSFVKELERAAQKSPRTEDLIGLLENSYRDHVPHWKHGGMAGVRGYGAGIVGRFSDSPEDFPGTQEYHTARINQIEGFFYTSDILRKLADICDEHAGGLFNFHGSTGDIQILGFKQEEAEELFQKCTHLGFDLGGSGSALRTPSCCVGPARCEWANYDTLHLTDNLTREYQNELHRPTFNYKFKIKCAGCPNDCIASGARSDLSIVGVWKDNIRIDQKEVAEYAKKFDIKKYVVDKCPTHCMDYTDGKLTIDDSNCVKCMHCINSMPKALRPGLEKGAQIRIGAKVPMVQGPRLGFILIPFYDVNKDKEEDYAFLKDLIQKIWDFWDEYGTNRERVGELIQRVGVGNFLEAIGLDPLPEMVEYPRANPFIKFEEYLVPDDEEEGKEG
ncbi:dissimilatory-type sulfite reductase subunit alpha [Desulfurella sp.]|uniref:dissimilatory-type sulfite reductase subunit alpha n=1 Tax=Desulfurella sp. TaxID=1962857 RepID=UPI0025C294F0|nr:dissimilatory-type sulfite reductase subunit alpha [Desulfurella sp.]